MDPFILCVLASITHILPLIKSCGKGKSDDDQVSAVCLLSLLHVAIQSILYISPLGIRFFCTYTILVDWTITMLILHLCIKRGQQVPAIQFNHHIVQLRTLSILAYLIPSLVSIYCVSSFKTSMESEYLLPRALVLLNQSFMLYGLARSK